MKFSQLEIKEFYDSVRDDVYVDFFSHVLEHSEEVRRFGGSFDSKNFVTIAQGMGHFIRNDGQMKLMLFSNLLESDVLAINQGLKTEEDLVLKNWIEDWNSIPKKFISDHTKALSWMLKNNYLEIRIIKITDGNGKQVSYKQIEHIAKTQETNGFFIGTENDEVINFTGNLEYVENENDYSHITTYKSWSDGQDDYCDKNFGQFTDLWDGEKVEFIQNYHFQSFPLETSLKEKLIEISPNSKSDVVLERPFSLRPPQQKAVDSWAENQFHGIFEMATGTGKTRCAIGAIKKLETEVNNFLTVIVVPSDPLGIQWKEELEKWGYKSTLTMQKTPKQWQQDVEDFTRLASSSDKKLCIITSYNTYANIKFKNILFSNPNKIFLIADEVHHAGAEKSSDGLDDRYTFKLGLTATLQRYFDDDGTALIKNFFSGVVFKYDISDGIRDDVLCSYRYNVIPIDLNEEEYELYKIESKTMGANYKERYNDSTKMERYLRAAERRANIIKNASAKLDAFKTILKDRKNMGYGLVYCNPGQIDEVREICIKNSPDPIYVRKITEKNTPTRKERQVIIDGMIKGDYDALLAIKILDEGWDCPELKYCILMASSGNDKEYVQRRGRILRKFRGTYPNGDKKTRAEIYDLCVIPDVSGFSDEDVSMEVSLAEKEFKRMRQISDSSENPEDCKLIIEQFLKSIKKS
jgi:superfamily II DNA or RNA helicase